MRRYTITVNNTPHVIDVEEVTASSFRVSYDGRAIDVRLEDHHDLAQAVIAPTLEVRESVRPVQPTPTIPVPLPHARMPSTADAAPVPGQAPLAHLTAPMPGVVLSVDTAAGAQVRRGDPLLVLEAMKMKNSLHAPRDGVVADVRVKAGQQVTYGEVLVTFHDPTDV